MLITPPGLLAIVDFADRTSPSGDKAIAQERISETGTIQNQKGCELLALPTLVQNRHPEQLPPPGQIPRPQWL